MYTYSLTEDYVSEHNDAYTSFGIKCTEDEKTILSVSDISTYRDKVKQLAELLTIEQLSPVHLPDVIEDFLP